MCFNLKAIAALLILILATSGSIAFSSDNFMWYNFKTGLYSVTDTSRYDPDLSAFLVELNKRNGWSEGALEGVREILNVPYSNICKANLYTDSKYFWSTVDIGFTIISDYDEKRKEDVIYIVFEGSKEFGDWFHDALAIDAPVEGFSDIHAGFARYALFFIYQVLHSNMHPDIKFWSQKYNNYTTLSEVINDSVSGISNPQIVLTGHSLGGAVAEVVGKQLIDDGLRDNVVIYT